MALPVPQPGRWTTDYFDLCAEPGGFGRCLYVSYCFPCALSEVVNKVVAADPSATHLKGCCGDAGVTCIAYQCIPYCGACLAINSLLVPLQARIAPAGLRADDCCETVCCSTCALLQMSRELDLRAAAGQPVVQPQGMYMVVPPQVVTMNPVVAMPQQQQLPVVVAAAPAPAPVAAAPAPAPVAAAVSPLTEWLKSKDLEDAAVEAALRSAGVATVDDLSHLGGDDVQAMSLNIVQKKKLRTALGK
jgi:hypothetical protein